MAETLLERCLRLSRAARALQEAVDSALVGDALADGHAAGDDANEAVDLRALLAELEGALCLAVAAAPAEGAALPVSAPSAQGEPAFALDLAGYLTDWNAG